MHHTSALECSGKPGALERCCVVARLAVFSPVRALLALAITGLICTNLVHSKSGPELSDRPVLALAELPSEGQQTYRLVLQGGPFPHEKDGTVFGNRERQLPRQARGYYREYTVKTSGASDRGARRIVCGGEQPQKPQVCYYTADHYASFRMIVPAPH
jgi:ribonuclease T1